MKVDLLAGTANPGAGDGGAAARRARILVFDSGLGGLTVHGEIAKSLPSADLIYLGDTAVFPYGRLSETELVDRVVAVIGEAIATHDPGLAVIACNTASTLALPVLRAKFPIPFVGTVPAIKPAASLSTSRRISVLATPGTVARDYTRELVAVHAQDCRVRLVGSPRLASLAEAILNGLPVEDAAILEEIRPAFVEEDGARTDVVVLACTHYPLILDRLADLAPWSVQWIDSGPAIARRVLSLTGELPEKAPPPRRAFFTGHEPVSPALQAALAGRGIYGTDFLSVTER